MQNRLRPFERVLNFRDFGGYDAQDGARVKSGVLWRSAHLSDASDADLAALNAMGIRYIVDLRRPEERLQEPNRWPGDGGRTFFNDEGPALALPPHLAALMQDDLTAQGVRDYMLHAYEAFPYEPRHVQLFSAWFKALDEEGGPALVHCAAGKDRTGLICALTLHVLGVDRTTIFADYDLTNTFLDLDARLPRMKARMEKRLGRAIAADALRPMLGVDADYLNRALDTIAATSGSMDAYLAEELGVDDARKARLRAALRD